MRSLIIAVIIVALIIGFGIWEVNAMIKKYDEINKITLEYMDRALNKKLTREDMIVYIDEWIKLRERAEILLPHVDVYECNLRISDAKGYVDVGDYENAYVQLCVVEELTRYVPHLIKPSWQHII